MGKIFLIDGTIETQSFELKPGPNIIGRGSESDIQIADPSVSLRHVKIWCRDSRFFIEDLNSQNGSLIDGKPMVPGREYEAVEGQLVTIGNILISIGQLHTENGVEERTSELRKTNELLQKEVDERKNAEENLKAMHDQLMEANKYLSLAYSQMRDWKDRLSYELFGEEIGFLIDESGTIQGITEKAMEATGMSRMALLGGNITNLVHKEARRGFIEDIKKTRIGLFHQTAIRVIGGLPAPMEFDVKMLPMSTKKERMLLILFRK
ncbi:MAG: FHA domain-containing protein [Deltaproteobacteria bacterium]|nr:FHA domain-containing protein [Deltaproteobacteria bacterium]